MPEIDPAAVMAAHASHRRGEPVMCCWSADSDCCEPYRLAETLVAEQKAYHMCERALAVVERRLEWFEAQYRNQYARSADA